MKSIEPCSRGYKEENVWEKEKEKRNFSERVPEKFPEA